MLTGAPDIHGALSHLLYASVPSIRQGVSAKRLLCLEEKFGGCCCRGFQTVGAVIGLQMQISLFPPRGRSEWAGSQARPAYFSQVAVIVFIHIVGVDSRIPFVFRLPLFACHVTVVL